MTSRRNNKIRDAINLIVEVQRESSGWFSLADWVDIIEEVLRFQSQWGYHILLYNRLVGKLLSEKNVFAKVYDWRSGVTSYMIDLKEDYHYTGQYERAMKLFNQFLRVTRHKNRNIIFTTQKSEGF